MTCPRCQTPVVPGAAFCLECGLPLTNLPGSDLGAASAAGGVEGVPASPELPAVSAGSGAADSSSAPPYPPAAPYGGAYPSYAPPPSQPLYPPAAPQATYPPAQPQSPYAPPPSQPLYAPPPSQPVYGTAPPVPQQYAAPSQPLYAPPPSQPMYGTAPPAPAQYGAPATVPLNLGQGQSPGAALLPGLLGAPPPGPAVPRTRLQAFLVRNVNARMAVSPWFTALLGAVAAIVIGLILTAVTETVWSSVIKSLASAASSNAATDYVAGLVSSTLAPDLLKLFMIEQHVPLDIHAAASASGTGGSLDIAVNFPITGLLLIPAIALTIGGYLSAASDFNRRARYSIARGALMGPFYGVLLAILTFFGTSNLSASLLGADLNVTLAPDTLAAFVYGLLWGLIFGALGGWLQFAGRRGFADALPAMRAAASRRVLGAIAGAVVALISGIAVFIALVVGVFVVAVTAQHATITPNTALSGSLGGANAAALVVMLSFALAPTLGIIAFTFAAGASFDISGATNVTSSGGSGISFGLIGAPQHPTNNLVYLLMLVPLVCYIAGGRVSARIAGARRPDEAMLAGALIALPFSILFAGVAALAGTSVDVNVLIASASGGAAPSLGGAFLAGLVGGAIGGAIGGASELAMPALGGVPRLLLLPFRPLALLLGPLLDSATGRPRGFRRSVARGWFYDGVTAALVLVIAGIALDIISALPAAVLPFNLITLLDSLIAGLLIAVPLIYFYGALVTAFSAPWLDPAARTAPVAAAPLPTGAPVPVYAGVPPAAGYYYAPPSAPGVPGAMPPPPAGYYGAPSAPVTSPPAYVGPGSAPITYPGQYSAYPADAATVAGAPAGAPFVPPATAAPDGGEGNGLPPLSGSEPPPTENPYTDPWQQ